MIQETSISGQVSKIISEKGAELLRISTVPRTSGPKLCNMLSGSRTEPRHARYARRREDSIRSLEECQTYSHKRTYMGQPGIRHLPPRISDHGRNDEATQPSWLVRLFCRLRERGDVPHLLSREAQGLPNWCCQSRGRKGTGRPP